jgi:hypothetical protein
MQHAAFELGYGQMTFCRPDITKNIEDEFSYNIYGYCGSDVVKCARTIANRATERGIYKPRETYSSASTAGPRRNLSFPVIKPLATDNRDGVVAALRFHGGLSHLPKVNDV